MAGDVHLEIFGSSSDDPVFPDVFDLELAF
jgi:hypothetical protein